MQKLAATSLAVLLTAGTFPTPALAGGSGGGSPTATPLKHIVIIFQENVSFDHYFGTYPWAANLHGEPHFVAKPGTPAVNGLTGLLLTNNPNATNTANGAGATNPFRLDRSQAATNDQDHDYTPEQMAFDRGLMDAFPVSVGTAGPPPPNVPIAATTGLTMGYYDGNTVTALWNYAQRYAMSDNSYDTNFGPSTRWRDQSDLGPDQRGQRRRQSRRCNDWRRQRRHDADQRRRSGGRCRARRLPAKRCSSAARTSATCSMTRA